MRFVTRTFKSKAEEIAHREQHARYVLESARRQRDAGFHPGQVETLVRSARVEWRKAQHLARTAPKTADALREAARQIEHGCEFNVNETLRWSAAEQAENSRRINEARALYDRADAIERRV